MKFWIEAKKQINDIFKQNCLAFLTLVAISLLGFISHLVQDSGFLNLPVRKLLVFA
ncbi:hypothetical protein [Treponema zioleckii]|uniref:hypothetical protein n=1 Tax=Treponema zioleckii TaxID=331680 RepID=UPI00168B1D1C|nr:hypothetical protein [Treponema zioleckii]